MVNLHIKSGWFAGALTLLLCFGLLGAGCSNYSDRPVVRVGSEGGRAIEDEVVLTRAELEAQEAEARKEGLISENDAPANTTLEVADATDTASDAQATSTTEDVSAPMFDGAESGPGLEEPYGDDAEHARMNMDFYGSEYRIGAGDQLGFVSFDDPSLSAQVMVRHDGYISLPWIPDIRVAGLTRTEATMLLREAYSELYYDAEVSMTILEARSQQFMVIGDVQSPSVFPYVQPMTLLEAITAAGGMRRSQTGGGGGNIIEGGQGQLVKAFVIRHQDGHRNVIEADLRGLQESGEHLSDMPIYPDDVVYVPEGINLVYVLGEAGRQAVVPIREGMTLLQLIANTGGLQETTARLNQVVLMREMSDGSRRILLLDVRQMLRTGEDFLIEAGDIVYFPRRRMENLRTFVTRVTGTISPALSLTSQVLSLYMQSYDAYYTKERFDRLFGDVPGAGVNSTLATLQTLRDLSAFTGDSFPIFQAN